MDHRYDPQEIEPRWQARWEEAGLHEIDVDAVAAEDTFYNLVEFPYPSAEGLHVGHAYTADVMNVALDENLRRALASGLRALEERVALAQKMSKRASIGGRTRVAQEWAEHARTLDHETGLIRGLVTRIEEQGAGPEEQLLKQTGTGP